MEESSDNICPAPIITFHDLPEEIPIGEDIVATCTIHGHYIPQILDKVYLSPVNGDEEIAEYDMWDFIAFENDIENSQYSSIGQVRFSSEHIQDLAREFIDEFFVLTYISKDYNHLGQSQPFKIAVEEYDSNIGMSFVMLSDIISDETTSHESDDLLPSPEKLTQSHVPTVSPMASPEDLYLDTLANVAIEGNVTPIPRPRQQIPTSNESIQKMASSSNTIANDLDKINHLSDCNKELKKQISVIQLKYEEKCLKVDTSLKSEQQNLNILKAKNEQLEVVKSCNRELSQQLVAMQQKYEEQCWKNAELQKQQQQIQQQQQQQQQQQKNIGIVTTTNYCDQSQFEHLSDCNRNMAKQLDNMQNRYEEELQMIETLNNKLVLIENKNRTTNSQISEFISVLQITLLQGQNNEIYNCEEIYNMFSDVNFRNNLFSDVLTAAKTLISNHTKLTENAASLQKMTEDYKNQLVETNTENARITHQLKALNEDQKFLRSCHMSPKTRNSAITKEPQPQQKSPNKRNMSEKESFSTTVPIPKYVVSDYNRPITQSIIDVPNKGNHVFSSAKYLKTFAKNETPMICPICLMAFKSNDSPIARNTHVESCIKQLSK